MLWAIDANFNLLITVARERKEAVAARRMTCTYTTAMVRSNEVKTTDLRDMEKDRNLTAMSEESADIDRQVNMYVCQ